MKIEKLERKRIMIVGAQRNPLEIIKQNLEKIPSIPTRVELVVFLNAQGKRNLSPDNSQLPRLSRHALWHKWFLEIQLGLKSLSKVDGEISRLFARVKLVGNDDNWDVFFSENI